MRSYTDTDEEVLLMILEKSESTAPVEISLGYVSKDSQCRAGIVVRSAPSAIIKAIVEDERVFTTHLEADGLHITTQAVKGR